VVDSDDMMAPELRKNSRLYHFRASTRQISKDNSMKKLLLIVLSLLLAASLIAATQNKNNNKNANGSTTTSKATNANRKPIFRATADQIKQTQGILKQRSFYSGEETGKLDGNTREGLKKYQQAESLKVTGTLNKLTLEKMGIALTDKQKTM
jgi:peptidoglycan hydrolase-like protein with peptidoglycan-binding domain